MKRLVTLLLALIMLMSMTAFAAEAYTFPLTEETITLTVFNVYRDHMTDVTTNHMFLDYEEKTGVHLELMNSADGATDLNLMMASGEHADIYLYKFTTAQITNMVNAGMLMPLNDLIEQYGVNTQQVFEEHPEFKDYLTTPDGNIYTLFETDIGVHMPNRRKMFVYDEWLKAYQEATGKEYPANIQEYEEMLVFFRDSDLNGNGVADEIPLIGSTHKEDDPIYWLMNAFTQISNDFIHITDDGEVVFEANSEEWKKGLEWIHHLYEEGLFYAEETYVQDRDQLKAMVNVADDSNYTVASAMTFWEGRLVDSSTKVYTDFAPIPPIAGDDGVARSTVTQMQQFYLVSAISSQCEYPEIAFKWLDWWVGEEGTFANVYGTREGENYEYVDVPSISGDEQSVKVLMNSYTDNFRYGENFVPKNDTAEIRYCVSADPSTYDTNNTYVLHRAGTMYEPYYVQSNIPAVVWVDDETLISEMAEYKSLINDTVKVAYTEFILGIRDIETEWDAYVEELNAVGLDYYLELLAQYYA